MPETSRGLSEVRHVHMAHDAMSVFRDVVDVELCNLHQSQALTLSFWLGVIGAVGTVVTHSWVIFAAAFLQFPLIMLAWSYHAQKGGYLPPSAREWLRAHRAEYKDLLRRVGLHTRAFNAALNAQKLLVEDPETLANLCAFWEERRAALQAELDAFVGTVAVLAKLGPEAAPPSMRKRIRKFRKDVQALLRMERAIGAYDAPGFKATSDLTLLISAATIRRRLELERETLGLKPRALPRTSASSKALLAANTET